MKIACKIRSWECAGQPVFVRADLNVPLQNNTIDLRDYEQAVDAQLMPSIESGRVLSDLFTKSPRFYFNLMKGDDRIWSYACDALLGRRPTYA